MNLLHFSSRLRPQVQTHTLLAPVRLARHSSTTSNRIQLALAAGFSAKNLPFDPEISVKTLASDSTGPVHTSSAEFETAALASLSKKARRERPRWISGQDAFFASSVVSRREAAEAGQLPAVAFGVIDGVGGWVESGIDPANFAQSLAANLARQHSSPTDTLSKSAPGPSALLSRAFSAVIRDPDVPGGGSTACLAIVDPNRGTLDAANLGDSGFLHISPYAIRFASPAQTHDFNTPYQLTKLPAAIKRQMALFGEGRASAEEPEEFEDSTDKPDDAAVTNHTLSPGDVVVFGTDGLWDNLFSAEVLEIVGAEMEKVWTSARSSQPDSAEAAPSGDYPTPPSTPADGAVATETRKGQFTNPAVLATRIASQITSLAKTASHNSKRDGPFARAAQASQRAEMRRRLQLLRKWKFPYGENLTEDEGEMEVQLQDMWSGGKVDDICVVVGVVSKADP